MSWESNEPCVSCGLFQEQSTCYHHIKSRKSHPEHENESWNKISVCLKCHNDFHLKGTTFMAVKSKKVMEWLKDNNWYFCKLTNKWRHEND